MKLRRFRRFTGACLFFVITFPALMAGSEKDSAPESARVVILANATDRSSMQIASHYAAARGIPAENIIALPVSAKETISVGEYVETIYNPLRRILIDDGWIDGSLIETTDGLGRVPARIEGHSISYLVVCRGVPVRIEDAAVSFRPNGIPEDLAGWLSSTVAGSVDGELALLAVPTHAMEGSLPNPLFGRPKGDHPHAARIIRVSRLDGPSAADVLRMIDRTLEAEETGLMGRAYIDIGNGPAGAADTGDAWLVSVGTQVAGAGFDTFIERSRRRIDHRDRRDAPAIYAGWYRPHAYGPFLDPGWAVPPGAIAYHLHSFSGTTIRSNRKAWVGPFVRLGFCATVGNVFEPTIGLIHRPQMFMEYLMEGRTWGEAVTASHPALSWQTLAIGDPLYRPFKTGLDVQLSDEIESPFKDYAKIRRINQLQAEGDADAALAAAESAMADHPSLPMAYKLADLYRENRRNGDAVRTLRVIEHLPIGAADELMLFRAMADLLHRLGEAEPALAVYKRILAYPGLDKGVRISLLTKGVKIAHAAGDARTAVEWGTEAERLKTPPSG